MASDLLINGSFKNDAKAVILIYYIDIIGNKIILPDICKHDKCCIM